MRVCKSILLVLVVIQPALVFSCNSKGQEDQSKIGQPTDKMPLAATQPTYESVGPELKYEFDIQKEEALLPNSQKPIVTYIVSKMIINGRSIGLTEPTRIDEESTTRESSSSIATRDYGAMNLNIHKGDGTAAFSLEPLMTREQKELLQKGL